MDQLAESNQIRLKTTKKPYYGEFAPEMLKNILLTEKSINYIKGNITRQLQRKLYNNEITYIIQYIHHLTNKHLVNYSSAKEAANDLSRYLSQYFQTNDVTNRLGTYEDESEEDDESEEERSDEDMPVSDYLKDEILQTTENSTTRTRQDVDWGKDKYQSQSIDYKNMPMVHVRQVLGFNDRFDFVNAVNPAALMRSKQLMLDSRNRILSDDNPDTRTTIRWNYHNDFRFEQGTVNAIGTIRDMVGIECGTVYFPNIDDTAFTEYRQITMFIHEFGAQSSIITAKERCHFVFTAENIASDSGTERLKLVSAFGGGTNAEFKFDRPIVSLDTITISFGSPAERLTLPRDRDTSPISITAANPAVITTSFSHGMSNSDLVYLEGVTSDNPSTESAVISSANRAAGWVISNVTATTFEIASLDTSSLTNPTITNVIFGSQRVFIPLVIRYMVGQKRPDE